MKPWRFAAIAALLGAPIMAVLASCGDPTAGIRDGRVVFDKMCTSCHGAEGKPPASMVARLGVRDLTDPAFRARVTPELVEQQVRRGSKSKLMPSFAGVIDDAQISAVAAFVASPQFLARP